MKLGDMPQTLPGDTVVIDLDGTLANIDHRVHFVNRENPDWDAFYDACNRDKINQWCAQLMGTFYAAHAQVAIVSGRRKSTEKATLAWLHRHKVAYDQLFLLRGDNDYTPDVELKKKWLGQFGKENILFVVDDRQRVVDMWRSEGVICLQCYAWKEFEGKST